MPSYPASTLRVLRLGRLSSRCLSKFPEHGAPSFTTQLCLRCCDEASKNQPRKAAINDDSGMDGMATAAATRTTYLGPLAVVVGDFSHGTVGKRLKTARSQASRRFEATAVFAGAANILRRLVEKSALSAMRRKSLVVLMALWPESDIGGRAECLYPLCLQNPAQRAQCLAAQS